MSESIECWHFAEEDLKLRYGDDRLIEIGAIHEVTVTPKCCEAGLHGSIRAIDALEYAPGPVICRVLISGAIHQQKDKLCGKRRRYMVIADASDELFRFSRWCTLQVIHLWEAPEIVKRYLETGEESIKDEARDAVKGAACWDAAGAAAKDAALYAASDAFSACDSAWVAARDAARAAAWDAARDAAWAAGWEAAKDAARYAQNAELDRRLRKLLNLPDAA